MPIKELWNCGVLQSEPRPPNKLSMEVTDIILAWKKKKKFININARVTLDTIVRDTIVIGTKVLNYLIRKFVQYSI